MGNKLLIFAAILVITQLSKVEGKLVFKRQVEDYIGVECTFDGRTFKSGTTIKDGCNYCRCIEGLVACSVGSIDKGCLYYENTESTTPPPNGCKFENQYRYDGEIFIAKDGCNQCWCDKGTMVCPYQDKCENAVARRRSLDPIAVVN